MNKLLILGMLCSFVVSEPACKKKAPEDMPAACHSDLVTYRIALDQDKFIDHYKAFKYGSVAGLDSAIDFTADWNNDGCPASTGIDAEQAAKVGLSVYYKEQCANIHPTKEDMDELLSDARLNKDAVAAQLYMLSKLCTNINQGKDKDPSVKLPSDDTTTL